MTIHVCRPYGLRGVALILIALAATARAEDDPVAERIREQCPTVGTIPDQQAENAAPARMLDCGPTSIGCHVVPMSVFCPTVFPERGKRDDRALLTRHLVVMNANPKLLFNISQFEVQSKNKNAATPIKGCTGDFDYLDRCIVSVSRDNPIVRLYMRDVAGTLEQEIDFSAACSTELTDRMQEVLRLFDELPKPTRSPDHRVILVAVPREADTELVTACASK